MSVYNVCDMCIPYIGVYCICIDEKKIDPHFHLSHFSEAAVKFRSKCPAWGRLESQPGLEACQSPGVFSQLSPTDPKRSKRWAMAKAKASRKDGRRSASSWMHSLGTAQVP